MGSDEKHNIFARTPGNISSSRVRIHVANGKQHLDNIVENEPNGEGLHTFDQSINNSANKFDMSS